MDSLNLADTSHPPQTEQERILSALSDASEGRYDAALSSLESVLQKNPRAEAAWTERGKLLRFLRRFPEAADHFLRTLELNPRNGEALRELAGTFRESGDTERPLRVFAEWIEKDPENAPLRREWGRICLTAGHVGAAVEALERARELDHDDTATLCVLGQAYAAGGRREEAVRAWEKTVSLDPSNGLALAELGRVRREAGKWAEAMEFFAAALKTNPNDHDLRVELARAQAAAGFFDEALDNFRDVLRQDASNRDAVAGLGEICRRNLSPDQASSLLSELLARHPDNAALRRESGKTLLHFGRHEAALEELDRAFDLAPADRETVTLTVRACRALGRLPETAGRLERAVQRDPRNAAAWSALGRIRRDERNHPAALDAFQKAVEADPSDTVSQAELGGLYKALGRYAEAIDIFRKLAEGNPRDGAVVAELGDACRRADERELPVRLFGALLRADPLNGALHRELGKTYLEYGEYRLASEELARARELEPDSRTLLALAQAHAALGRNEEAAQMIGEAVRLDPDNGLAQAEWARVQRDKKRFDEARQAYATALRLNPVDPDLQWEMVEMCVRERRFKEAEEYAQKGAEFFSDDPFVRDRFLNELEILRGKTVLDSHPKLMWVTVTSVCNIRCRMCSIWENPWFLPRKTAEEVMQFYPYLQRIVWLGGEVFLYKGFQELFEEGAKHPRMTQQITTNGVILTEEWIERIMNVPNVELTISVDGATREVYEYIRKGAKFDDLTGKIRRINELREKRRWPGTLRINTVVMKSNYRQLDSFVEFADEHGFDRLSLMAVQNDGDPAEAIFDGRGDAEALSFITEAIPRLRATAKAKGLDLDVLLPTNERSFEKIESAQAALPPEQRTVYCKYPWKILQLAGHGKAELTGSCLKSIGNYHEKSLWEIWNSPVAQDYRKAMLASTFRGFCRPECMSRWDL